MFDKFYPFTPLGRKETGLPDPIAVIQYRFNAKHRTYLVRVEEYNFGFCAIKFCDIKDKNNHLSAYQKIFNDGDFFRVLATCVYIMFKLWQTNPSINFVFYAVPRNVTVEDLSLKKIESQSVTDFLENYKRTRFKVYEYAMLNLFPPDEFIQLKDFTNCIYALINRKNNETEMINRLGNFLFKNHDIIFETTRQ